MIDVAQMRWESPLTCPSCEHHFKGEWAGAKTADHACPECGHVFEATWPGFNLTPDMVHYVDGRWRLKT